MELQGTSVFARQQELADSMDDISAVWSEPVSDAIPITMKQLLVVTAALSVGGTLATTLRSFLTAAGIEVGPSNEDIIKAIEANLDTTTVVDPRGWIVTK